MAIKMDEYEKIRYMKEVERVRQREAAKRLGLSRNTVRRYWDGETVPWERRSGSGRKNKSPVTHSFRLNILREKLYRWIGEKRGFFLAVKNSQSICGV